MADLIQKITATLPEGQNRIESGSLQINDDWPGVFIRGDNSGWLAMQLACLLDRLKRDGVKLNPIMEEAPLKEAIGLFGGCIQGPAKDVIQSVSG